MHAQPPITKRLLLTLLLAIPILALSQAELKVTQPGVSVNDNGENVPDVNAVFDVSSGAKGVIFPRLTSAQRDQMINPTAGLLIFNSDLCVYQYFNGVTWTSFGDPPQLDVPATPTNFVVYYGSQTEVTLTWTDAATVETGYVVERATDDGFTIDLVSFELPANTSSYTDQVGAGGGVYHYRVKAVNACQAGAAVAAQIAPPFVSVWETTTSSETITLPLVAVGTYNFTVDWGDGSAAETITVASDASHEYASADQYTITISGTMLGWRFYNQGDKDKILDVTQWGGFTANQVGSFWGCSNLDVTALDGPSFDNTQLVTNFFRDCTSLKNENGSIGSWNMTGVTSLTAFFWKATQFDVDLSAWDLSSCTSIAYMFSEAASFNQPLNSWDVSSVTSMKEAFRLANAFNQDLDLWDVSNVEDMNSMFRQNTAFTGQLDGWGSKTANVTNMSYMFSGATAFNQPLNSWDVSAVTTMFSMFSGATSFNQDLDNWRLTACTSVRNMFYKATAFNGAVNGWGNSTSGIANFELMFFQARAFNQPLDSWNMSGATTINSILRQCDLFNQPLANWERSGSTLVNVTDMNAIFDETPNFNRDISNWNTSSVETMFATFRAASAFNSPLDSWNVGNVTRMDEMFRGATSFNQPLNNWERSGSTLANVTDMPMMFMNASSFNQALDDWDVSSVTTMFSMFQGASLFNRSLGNWNLSSCTTIKQMFFGATNFNGDVDGWGQTTSNITSMANVFQSTPFNKSISSWNTSSVWEFTGMFAYNTVFNQSVNGLVTSAGTITAAMFWGATAFDQDLSTWDVSNVTAAQNMFKDASSFNQNLGAWNVSNLADAPDMFLNATGMSISNMSSTLIGWEGLSTLQSNVTLRVAPNGLNTAGDVAANSLESTYNWTIN